MAKIRSRKLQSVTSARPARNSDQLWIAFAWMALSGLGFSFMSIFVKRLSPAIPQFELVFFGSSVNFLIAFSWAIIRRDSFFPPGKPLLVFRGILGFCGVSCLFYAIAHLPLSISVLLNWSSPIFVILFSALFLHERIGRKALLGVAVAFMGLIVLLRPDQGLSAGELNEVAVGIGLLGAVIAGLAYVAVRAATARVGVNGIILYFTGTAALISAPLAAQNFHIPEGWQKLELVLVGLLASVGQYSMTQAYGYARAGLVSTMGLMNAAYAAFFGWALFGEILAPLQWVGMSIMGLGIASASYFATKTSASGVALGYELPDAEGSKNAEITDLT